MITEIHIKHNGMEAILNHSLFIKAGRNSHERDKKRKIVIG
jgi:hypothetical protein